MKMRRLLEIFRPIASRKKSVLPDFEKFLYTGNINWICLLYVFLMFVLSFISSSVSYLLDQLKEGDEYLATGLLGLANLEKFVSVVFVLVGGLLIISLTSFLGKNTLVIFIPLIYLPSIVLLATGELTKNEDIRKNLLAVSSLLSIPHWIFDSLLYTCAFQQYKNENDSHGLRRYSFYLSSAHLFGRGSVLLTFFLIRMFGNTGGVIINLCFVFIFLILLLSSLLFYARKYVIKTSPTGLMLFYVIYCISYTIWCNIKNIKKKSKKTTINALFVCAEQKFNRNIIYHSNKFIRLVLVIFPVICSNLHFILGIVIFQEQLFSISSGTSLPLTVHFGGISVFAIFLTYYIIIPIFENKFKIKVTDLRLMGVAYFCTISAVSGLGYLSKDMAKNNFVTPRPPGFGQLVFFNSFESDTIVETPWLINSEITLDGVHFRSVDKMVIVPPVSILEIRLSFRYFPSELPRRAVIAIKNLVENVAAKSYIATSQDATLCYLISRQGINFIFNRYPNFNLFQRKVYVLNAMTDKRYPNDVFIKYESFVKRLRPPTRISFQEIDLYNHEGGPFSVWIHNPITNYTYSNIQVFNLDENGIYVFFLFGFERAQIKLIPEIIIKKNQFLLIPIFFVGGLSICLESIATNKFVFVASPEKLRITGYVYCYVLQHVGRMLALSVVVPHYKEKRNYLLKINVCLFLFILVLFVCAAALYEDIQPI